MSLRIEYKALRQELAYAQGIAVGAAEAADALEEAGQVLQAFVHWSQPLPKLAGSQWASVTRVPYEGQMSQICHWLNETSKEADVLLAKIEASRKPELDVPCPYCLEYSRGSDGSCVCDKPEVKP